MMNGTVRNGTKVIKLDAPPGFRGVIMAYYLLCRIRRNDPPQRDHVARDKP
jgi:hypothetical protein